MSEKGKTIWVRSDHLPTYDERKKIVSTALESGYSTIMIRAEDKELKRLGRFEAIEVNGKVMVQGGRGDIVTHLKNDQTLFDNLYNAAMRTLREPFLLRPPE